MEKITKDFETAFVNRKMKDIEPLYHDLKNLFIDRRQLITMIRDFRFIGEEKKQVESLINYLNKEIFLKVKGLGKICKD